MKSFVARLEAALAAPLPGPEAQRRLAPAGRALLTLAEMPEQTRSGGVLALLYPAPENDRVMCVLTRRTDGVATHKGQISFPGGARESGEDLVETALRETYEEMGVASDSIRVVGRLTPLYVPASGFSIHPFVGWIDRRPSFRPDPREVAEIIEIPLSILRNPAIVVREIWTLRGREVEVPFYAIDAHKVWGATAMILAELLSALEA